MNKSEYASKYLEIRRTNFRSIMGADGSEEEFQNNWFNEESFPEFIQDVEKVAAGRPITSDAFIMALTMWESDGNIRSGIFSDSPDQVFKAVKDFDSSQCSVENFVDCCLRP